MNLRCARRGIKPRPAVGPHAGLVLLGYHASDSGRRDVEEEVPGALRRNDPRTGEYLLAAGPNRRGVRAGCAPAVRRPAPPAA